MLYTAIRIIEGLIIIALQVRPLGSLRVISLHRPMIQRRTCRVLEFLAFLFWLNMVLSFFGLLTPLIATIEAVLNANLAIGSFKHYSGPASWCSWSQFGLLFWSRNSCVFFWKKTFIIICISRAVFRTRFQRCIHYAHPAPRILRRLGRARRLI